MFIRVEDQSGNLTIWLNVNQIAKMEESRSSEELMGYSIILWIIRSIILQMLRLYRLY